MARVFMSTNASGVFLIINSLRLKKKKNLMKRNETGREKLPCVINLSMGNKINSKCYSCNLSAKSFSYQTKPLTSDKNLWPISPNAI